jgi:phospholipid/cholesterol/gamma-HCH transport system substrate-binding protein
MKFSIRFADQIVGALIILALGIIIFVIFMLGSNQRWFSRDYYFLTYFPSASGLSQNMPVQYKGFTIGRVKSIQLNKEDRVEVRFSIFDTYIERVKVGSLVELRISPIGALGGNQFLFHPGMGTKITEGIIPAVGSPEAKLLLDGKLVQLSAGDDSINKIITSVGTTIDDIDILVKEVNEALKGEDKTKPVGKTLADIDKLMAELNPAMANIKSLSERAAKPDGSVAKILDSNEGVYQELTKSLKEVSGTMQNLKKTSDFIPEQLPQIAVVITDLQKNLELLEGVLTSLTTNPLFKPGVPERKETKTGGAQTRDVEF